MSDVRYFAYSALINSVVIFAAGPLILVQDFRSQKNWLFAGFCLSVSIWAAFYCFWLLASSAALAILYIRLAMAGAILLVILHYHHLAVSFSLTSFAQRFTLLAGYGIAGLLLLSLPTRFFIASVAPRSFFSAWPRPGPMFHAWVLFFLVFISIDLAETWKFRQGLKRPLRRDVDALLFFIALGYLAGLLNIPLWYGINVVPYVNVLVAVALLGFILCYYRIGLLDVGRGRTRLTLLALVYFFLISLAFAVGVPVVQALLRSPLWNTFSVTMATSAFFGLLLSTGPFIYARLVKNSFWLRAQHSTGLAHELKSPLAAIQGSIEVLQAALRPGVTPDIFQNHISVIERNAERLERYIQELLDLARIESGKIETRREIFDLPSLVAECIETHQASAESQSLQIIFSHGALANCFADREKLSQIFSNLISNAIKFSRNGRINIDIESDSEGFICAIKDEGIGVSKNELERIFERFYQSNRKTARGSGLGLAIAKAWVEAHGGHIWAESEGEAKGTKVTFTLPLHDNS